MASGTTCQRELSGEEVQDNVKWRRLIRNIDPTYMWGRTQKEKTKNVMLRL